jgi:hypothetical protein
MNVLIASASTTNANGSTYKSFELTCENKSAIVMVVSGKINYVNVVVTNAMHRAFRGLGKDFATFEAAIENYKDSKIKAMIEAAKFEA